jgi:hypothetical protein
MPKKIKLEITGAPSKLIETPIFDKLMRTNNFKQIWNFRHYSDNYTLDDEADRLYKIRPILDNLVENFRKHCKPSQELSLDEAMSHGESTSGSGSIILVNL